VFTASRAADPSATPTSTLPIAVPRTTGPLTTSLRRMLPLDVEVQIEQLAPLDVAADHIYIDRGFSGTHRDG